MLWKSAAVLERAGRWNGGLAYIDTRIYASELVEKCEARGWQVPTTDSTVISEYLD